MAKEVKELSQELSEQGSVISSIVGLLDRHITITSSIVEQVRLLSTTVSMLAGALIGIALANSKILEIMVERYRNLSENWQIALFSTAALLAATLLGVWLGFFLNNKRQRLNNGS